MKKHIFFFVLYSFGSDGRSPQLTGANSPAIAFPFLGSDDWDVKSLGRFNSLAFSPRADISDMSAKIDLLQQKMQELQGELEQRKGELAHVSKTVGTMSGNVAARDQVAQFVIVQSRQTKSLDRLEKELKQVKRQLAILLARDASLGEADVKRVVPAKVDSIKKALEALVEKDIQSLLGTVVGAIARMEKANTLYKETFHQLTVEVMTLRSDLMCLAHNQRVLMDMISRLHMNGLSLIALTGGAVKPAMQMPAYNMFGISVQPNVAQQTGSVVEATVTPVSY